VLIVVFAAAMCLAMLIATAFAIREEAENTRLEVHRVELDQFTVWKAAGGRRVR
jgi:hypothetical protein